MTIQIDPPISSDAEQNSQQNTNMPRMDRGKSIRDLWYLEDGLTYLNHGAFGALPKTVHKAANEWRLKIEQQPSVFYRDKLGQALRESASIIGKYVGAQGEDIVFVDNATTAVNSILRSLVLLPGDEIVTTNHSFGAVLRTLEFVCERAGARLHQANIPFPIHDPEDASDAIISHLSPRTRLVVVDHITSSTGIKLPLENIIAECNDRDIPVMVDGAHAPGFLKLNLDTLGASWYVGNGHKWLGAPKGVGFLWTKPELQNAVRPTTISHFISQGYTAAFDWPGTKDFSPYLCLADAIKFRAEFGEDAIYSYCTTLLKKGADHLAKTWRTERGTPDAMTGAMVALKWPGKGKATTENADKLRLIFRETYRIEVELKLFNGKIWIRVCAYLYNEMADFELLAKAGLEVIKIDLDDLPS